jgi:Lrp/AsnC family leucine-responsive transcriptional regulator
LPLYSAVLIAKERAMRKLDIIDRKLLDAVQWDANRTAEQLGAACGLSPTAALKRLKKLRSDGVVEREMAVISPKALGLTIMAIVMVSLEREDRTVIESFSKDIRTTDQIMQGFYITGESDFILMITARDMDEYDEFTRTFFYDRHKIKNFKTSIVINVLKSGATLPILDI